MGRITDFLRVCSYGFVIILGLACIRMMPRVEAWGKEGHVMTCQIAQAHLQPEAAEAVRNLLPDYANGDLSALCTWPDQIRHWSKYGWTSSLHFIDTPDKACTYDYSRDCHDPHGMKNMCVAGAIQNFTSQLLHYRGGTSDRRYNLTEALIFLSHFMGDVHQPLHVGFTNDKGGNGIGLHWFKHKSNLHHVSITEYGIARSYLQQQLITNRDIELLQEAINRNITRGIWSDDVSLWNECNDLLSCSNKYAAESVSLACKWGYQGAEAGATLADEYFNTRMPVVMKRIGQGGIRLSMILNRVFGHGHPREVTADSSKAPIEPEWETCLYGTWWK